jgi:hypothetical protein
MLGLLVVPHHNNTPSLTLPALQSSLVPQHLLHPELRDNPGGDVNIDMDHLPAEDQSDEVPMSIARANDPIFAPAPATQGRANADANRKANPAPALPPPGIHIPKPAGPKMYRHGRGFHAGYILHMSREQWNAVTVSSCVKLSSSNNN